MWEEGEREERKGKGRRKEGSREGKSGEGRNEERK